MQAGFRLQVFYLDVTKSQVPGKVLSSLSIHTTPIQLIFPNFNAFRNTPSLSDNTNTMLTLQNSKTKWVFLVAGLLCFLLSGPAFQVGILGWIAPAGILFFTRISHPFKGYLWAVLGVVVYAIMQGIMTSPLPMAAIIPSAVISAVLKLLPYLADRLMVRRLKPGLALLVFPVVSVSYEYLIAQVFGSQGVLATSQAAFLEFIQLASVTGVLGVSFMMYWFASLTVEYLQVRGIHRVQRMTFATLFLAILVFGSMKIRMINPTQETVKVSGIALEQYPFWETMYADLFHESFDMNIRKTSSPEFRQVMNALPKFLKDPRNAKFKDGYAAMQRSADQLIELTEREAHNGAKIIVWSETNLMVFQTDEAQVLERVTAVAKAEQVSILASMAVLLPYQEGGVLYENKSVLITSDGEIADTYQKAKPVPFLDASKPGDGKLALVKTANGTLTTAICFDGDFPDLIAQSGKADILLLPAKDWLGISPFHGDIAVFRAIENGVSIVRPTSTGRSVVYDGHGRELAALEAFDQEVRILEASVPTTGVRTIFNALGNWFVWMCIAAFIVLLGLSFIKLKA
jgi:apolipoprotein N-acyltransferase